MRLVTVCQSGRESVGIVIDDHILDLAGCVDVFPAASAIPHCVRGILEGGADVLMLVRRIADRAGNGQGIDHLRDLGALIHASSAKLGAPISNPRMIFAGGLNYHGHLKEMNTAPTDSPFGFLKSVAAVIGPQAPIVLPRTAPDMVDWEGEFCAVIGRFCHDVNASDALDYVAGYTLINDVSARDWAASIALATGTMGPVLAWDRNILGKQFPTFCPMGPVIVTADEMANPDSVQISTTLNGQIMQSANTADLVFNVPRLIEYYSRFYTLSPGDLITTGTPAGVGYGRSPKMFMKPGDRIEVQADGIGTLSNPVIAG
jgi:acylpyruvate hydrolase